MNSDKVICFTLMSFENDGFTRVFIRNWKEHSTELYLNLVFSTKDFRIDNAVVENSLIVGLSPWIIVDLNNILIKDNEIITIKLNGPYIFSKQANDVTSDVIVTDIIFKIPILICYGHNPLDNLIELNSIESSIESDYDITVPMNCVFICEMDTTIKNVVINGFQHTGFWQDNKRFTYLTIDKHWNTINKTFTITSTTPIGLPIGESFFVDIPESFMTVNGKSIGIPICKIITLTP